MNLFRLYKLVGRFSRVIFLYLPFLYFQLYSFYKRLTDAYKHELIKKFVASGDYVIDIGAHIGYYSLLLAGLVGKDGRVFAFEASPENFKHLLRNTAKFETIKAYNTAAGNETGETLLYLSPFLDVDHRIYKSSSEKRSAVPVKLAKLDDLMTDTNKKIAFIKMDIQGSEQKALEGMAELLKKDRPVILTELWPWGLREAGSSVGAFLTILNNLSYQVRLIDERNKRLVQFDIGQVVYDESVYYDLLCEPRSSEAAVFPHQKHNLIPSLPSRMLK